MERGLKSYSVYCDTLQKENYKIQGNMIDPIVFQAKTDEDTICFDQAIKEVDTIHFRYAIIKEIKDHCNRKHWTIIKRS